MSKVKTYRNLGRRKNLPRIERKNNSFKKPSIVYGNKVKAEVENVEKNFPYERVEYKLDFPFNLDGDVKLEEFNQPIRIGNDTTGISISKNQIEFNNDIKISSGTNIYFNGSGGKIENATLEACKFGHPNGFIVNSEGEVTKIGQDTPTDGQVLSWDNTNSKVVWNTVSAGSGDIEGVDLTGGTGIEIASETGQTSGSYSATINCNLEGTELYSTGVSSGKVLTANGSNGSSWQSPAQNSFDVDGDTGATLTIDAGHTLTLAGGTGIDSSGSGSTITHALSSGAALANLGGGSGSTFLRKDGTFATPTNTNQLTTFNIGVDTNTNATTIAHGETLTFTGGTGISTETTTDGTITFTNTVANDDVSVSNLDARLNQLTATTVTIGDATDVTIDFEGAIQIGQDAVFMTQPSVTTGAGISTWTWTQGNKLDFTLASGAQGIIFDTGHPSGRCNVTLKLKQPSSGAAGTVSSWTATPVGGTAVNVKWAGGSAPTLSTANDAIDIISFYWDGSHYYGVASLNFS